MIVMLFEKKSFFFGSFDEFNVSIVITYNCSNVKVHDIKKP